MNKADILKKIERYLPKAILYLVVVLLIIIVVEFRCFPEWHNGGLSNTLFYAVFGILGVIATLYGIWLTYRQLKLAEDRIENYEDFYTAAIEIFKDERCEYIQFSGSTTIPGHIAYGNPKHVKEEGDYGSAFLECVKKLYNVDSSKDNSKLIIPTDFTSTYNKFKNKKYPYKFQGTDREITQKVNAIKHFSDETLNTYCLFRKDSNDSSFINGFYLSNGKTMVYAMNTHYEQADIIEETTLKPVLVGFKTKNTTIVNAFKERFDQKWTSLNDTPDAETNP